MTYNVTFDPAMLFENGKTAALVTVGGGNDYYNVGNGAYWKFTTSARYLEVDCYVTSPFAVGVQSYRLGVRVLAGATLRDYFYTVPPSQNAAYTAKFWLPPGTGKTVQVFVPAQNALSAGAAPLGVYPIRARFDQPYSLSAPSLQASHLVVYGDSIASGGLAICPAQFGYCGLLKKGNSFGGYNGSVTQVSWGTRLLADDCSTSGARTTFAAALLALSPTKILLAIGSNDQALNTVTLANFTTYYTGLLDAIHSASANMPIVCLSPIRRGAEGANSNGNTMAQYRSAISTAVSARSGWAVPPTYVDGLAIFADLTMLPDNVHPNTAGNIAMRDAVLAAV